MATARKSRRSRWLALACCVLLLAVGCGAWLLARRPPQRELAVLPDAVALASSRAVAPMTEAAPVRAAHEPAPLGAQIVAPVESSRQELEREGAPHGEVLVVARVQHGGPVLPRCEVISFEGAARIELELEVKHRGFDFARLRRTGRITIADDEGRARVPRGNGRLVVCALAPGYWAVDVLPPDAAAKQGFFLECAPLHAVRVQVVDAKGEPRSGVEVCASPALSELITTAVTSGPQGIAELYLLDEDSGACEVQIAGAFPESARARVDPHALPADPIRLVLGAHGALEVRLRNSDGSAFGGAAEVELESTDEELELARLAPVSVAIGSGRALYPRVGLGLSFGARATIAGCGECTAAGKGPSREGETAVLVLELGRPFATVVGRACDREGRGRPYLELDAAGEWDDPGARSIAADASTDAVGRFAFSLELPGAAPAPAKILIHGTDREHPLGVLKALVLAVGTNDLGSLVLEDAPLLASGRLAAADGENLPAAIVELKDAAAPNAVGWALPSKCAASGAFELHGWTSEPTVDLRFRTPNNLQLASTSVALGASDVLVALQPKRKP